ncbi:MAG: UDP-N-acetylmuramoyl-tripeptide--D-alanyl-D-alanine ligase [Alphaproteobacteria bacterium]|nr:UDP-N-acetylmuramoyl-tripeptide--D-alanyl-D-alanine ligase [Alphaproteobacteria bacterium]
MSAWLGSSFLLAAFLFFAARRVKSYLHFYQQDDYEGAHFILWLWRTRSFDRRVSLTLLVLWGLAFVGVEPRSFLDLLTGALFLAYGLCENNPQKKAKKPLVMTMRAKRLWSVSLLLSVVAGGLVLWHSALWLWILLVQALPLLLVLADQILSPWERRIQSGFVEQARARLQKIDPLIIGVTGSFGKTSLKHILGHVLTMNAEAYFTPGSVNTLMGIARMVREKLPAQCRYFVVEMGAYKPGSITRLCDLTPPRLGLITALGPAHYERFKDLQTVARAKFELACEVLAHEDGHMIIHESVLNQDYARDFVASRRERFTVCGHSAQADVIIEHGEQTAKGLAVTLSQGSETFLLHVPLYGMQQVGNITLAFAAARRLGLQTERIIAALALIPQINHRLEVKRQANHITLIDDAYNANPVGFAAALGLLTLLSHEDGRRIIITPGLVEQGALHEQTHKELGRCAALSADLVIAIRPSRIPSFEEGFRQSHSSATWLGLEGMEQALAWLKTHARPHDVILLENDLPDLYERKLAL